MPPSAYAAKGVALVTTSAVFQNGTDIPGATQVVIASDQDASKNARPASAGFIKLCPSPPKNCFTITIENNAPITTIHSGIVTGRLNAKSIPVTTALKSPIVDFFLSSFSHAHSKNTQAKTLSTVTTPAR